MDYLLFSLLFSLFFIYFIIFNYEADKAVSCVAMQKAELN